MAQLTIGLSLSPTWLRGDAWRRPDSDVERMFGIEPLCAAAVLAEEAHLDFLFKPDALALDPGPLATSPGFSGLDPVVLMTALVQATSRIGLVPTVSSTFAHPYTIARQLQSLDRLSAGRVGWNVVTSLGGGENFGERDAPADPYADARDFVRVVEELRQTYPADALVLDREAGVFADVSRLSSVEPSGRHRSRGPVTVPAVSARPWPLLHAGGSPASLAFAAEHADAVFAMSAELSDSLALRQRMREAAGGRRVRLLPGLSLCLAATRDAARELAEERLPRPAHVTHWTVVGTPQDAVHSILERHTTGAVDGLIALPAGWAGSLDLFCTEVVPALVEAGAFRAEYAGATLHDHLSEEA